MATGDSWLVRERAWQSADGVALHDLLQPLQFVGRSAELAFLLVPLVMDALTSLFAVQCQTNAERSHLGHHVVFEQMELRGDVTGLVTISRRTLARKVAMLFVSVVRSASLMADDVLKIERQAAYSFNNSSYRFVTTSISGTREAQRSWTTWRGAEGELVDNLWGERFCNVIADEGTAVVFLPNYVVSLEDRVEARLTRPSFHQLWDLLLLLG